MDPQEEDKILTSYSTMTVVNPYSETTSKNIARIRKIEILRADSFLRKQKFDLLEVENEDFDLNLLRISEKNPQLVDPLLCLRCKISQYIFYSCQLTYKKIKDTNKAIELEINDILQVNLNDEGKITKEIYVQECLDSQIAKRKIKKEKINWESINKIFKKVLYPSSSKGKELFEEEKVLSPLSLEIIHTFNPKKGNLFSWSKLISERNYNLKLLLNKYFLTTHSKFSLINQITSIKILIKIWDQYTINKTYNQTSINSNQIIKIFKRFKVEYQKEKRKKNNNIQSNWKENNNFFKEYDKILGTLYLGCKQYNSNNKPIGETKEYQKQLQPEDSDKDISEIISEIIEIKTLDSLKKLAKETSKEYIKNKLIDQKNVYQEDFPKVKHVWLLYSEGKSNREIRKIVSKKSIWVKNILNLQRTLQDIARSTLERAKNIPLINLENPDDIDKCQMLVVEILNGKKEVNLDRYESIFKQSIHECLRK
tara:strand:- start:260 stop:1705 length:1446 start_codon:yes stop_codon:yes gene_type:complete